MRTYPGDWCFPGGRYESEDLTLENTAWRELREETSVPKTCCRFVVQLSDFYSGKGELVRPFVMNVDKAIFKRNFKTSSDEIVESTLVDLDTIKQIVEGVPNGKTSTRKPSYLLSFEKDDGLEYLWGLSASILVHIRNIIDELSIPVDYGESYVVEKGKGNDFAVD